MSQNWDDRRDLGADVDVCLDLGALAARSCQQRAETGSDVRLRAEIRPRATRGRPSRT